MFQGFENIGKVPELRRRVVFSLVVIALYRLGVFVTTPGVDRSVMKSLIEKQGGLLGMLNMFSGGALENLSIFALGIMPYISASIIMQLMGLLVKSVEEMRKEGESGRRKLEQYTRYGTIVLSMAQSYLLATQLEGQNIMGQGDLVANPGWSFRLMTMLTLTTGTALIMWLGEQVTERGIGNGISLIIFASIVSGIPTAVTQYWASTGGDVEPLTVILLLGLILVAIAIVVFFEKAQRRIPIQYARRQGARRIYGGETAHLPLKVNMASMIPPIFASSLLLLPATLANMDIPGMQMFSGILNRGDWVFHTLFAAFVIFFAFFYTGITFQAVDVAENLKKQQANIPGIRPGRQTAEYLDGIVGRLTVGGSLYIAAICVIPAILVQAMRVPFQFGGTSLMIVVGVALETVNQIEAHLITQSYEGLTGPRVTRLSGRRPA
ncbi:MAG: preprotein translocase subunit SecY [Sorangiineae bacterium NIC37A_2]|jgi:preprotein translocase subunit SecY|nr:MAG: preprotein translocase subunit SecY [Sorangiineae bacterium NIC37A_2]